MPSLFAARMVTLPHPNAGGICDDILRYPQFGKGLYFAEDGDVILTRPLLEVNGAVGGDSLTPAIYIA